MSNSYAYGIASGQPSGTNYPMVQDIVRVCSTPKNPISNAISDGSLDNLTKVYEDRNIQMGLTQVDALYYQKGIDKKMMSKIQIVFPFFSSEIHLIARADSNINSLSDLLNKKVDEDVQGSGSWVSAEVIKQLTGMSWNQVNLQQSQGLQALANGQIDAMFINAGSPIGMLEQIPAGLKLIPISSPQLDSFGLFVKTTIPSGTYPFQAQSVQTYKTMNALVTYAFQNQYQEQIGSLVTCVLNHLPTLIETGHPKWKNVDPMDITSIAWQVHPAALAAIQAWKKTH